MKNSKKHFLTHNDDYVSTFFDFPSSYDGEFVWEVVCIYFDGRAYAIVDRFTRYFSNSSAADRYAKVFLSAHNSSWTCVVTKYFPKISMCLYKRH